MENQNSRIGVIVLTIILTAVLVGGGVFFLQQNSIKELRKEIQNLQKTTTEESSTDGQITTPKTTDTNPSIKTPEIKENAASLPAGVEWLTYDDNDLSFVYPKTFLSTPLQESSDQNLARTKWEVSRQDNTIYIRPNFESPAAEFGATYEIQIIQNPTEAEKLHQSILWGEGNTKNLCASLNAIQLQGYNVCAFEREIDEGLGRVGKYYAVIPELKNGSQTPPWIYIFDESGGMYTNYINSTLLSSLKIK